MVKPQTVSQLLDKFDLKLELTPHVLSLEIADEYDSYNVIQRVLTFINSEGQLDLGKFTCYHFENKLSYCEIVPDCNYQTVLSFEKINGNWEGCSWDMLGNLSTRS